MASRPEYDGLHVQSLEGVDGQRRTPHVTQYDQTPIFNDKKVHPSNVSTPYYSQPQAIYPDESFQEKQLPPSPQARRNPWGLSPLVFAAIVALITAIIVGGAVGGGVAASKKDCPASASSNGSSGSTCATGSSSSSTTAPTGTFRNFVPPSPANVESLANDCSSINGTSIQSAQGTFFKLTCPQAILGSAGSNGITLSETVAYTLQDCINACSLMNFWKGATVCNSVTWDSGMAGATAANGGGNCWLFKDSSTIQIKANSTSARLQSS